MHVRGKLCYCPAMLSDSGAWSSSDPPRFAIRHFVGSLAVIMGPRSTCNACAESHLFGSCFYPHCPANRISYRVQLRMGLLQVLSSSNITLKNCSVLRYNSTTTESRSPTQGTHRIHHHNKALIPLRASVVWP